MCGIAGAVNWGDRESLARMGRLISHRGPDDHGLWEETRPDGTWIGLANRRLSIVDLSAAGHMPMSTDDGRFTITYNGEIYNAPALRARLESRGCRFHSHSDTEVVLQLYRELGPACVSELEGMFAFAVMDRQRNHLFLARDHFGIKPLYYIHAGDRFAFASEIKAFHALPDFTARLDARFLQQYLTFLWVPDPGTVFTGVQKLPAGHTATLHEGRLAVEQYWDLPLPAECQRYARPEKELQEVVRSEFERCVRDQTISDVPLGAFLSGGLDSSAIVAMLARNSDRPVKTYNISFPAADRVGENTLDDPQTAKLVAQRYGCDHHTFEIRPDVADLLPRLLYHMDEPTADPALIMAYLVCREARRDVKVLLSGVGGDEIFGGYRKYQAYYWAQTYAALPASLRAHVLEPLVLSLPQMRGSALQGWVRLAKKMARSASLSPEEGFLRNATYLGREDLSGLLAPELEGAIRDLDPWSVHRQHFTTAGHADFLHQMMYVDLKTFLVSLNLNYNDKMSMAASLEVRVPFLDRRFVEMMMRELPPDLKMQGRLHRPKAMLRAAFHNLLPAEVLQAPKAGFGAPIAAWLANDLREMVEELLGTKQVAERGIFRPEAVRRMIDEQQAGARDWSYQIWQLLTLEIWCRVFNDGRLAEFSLDPPANPVMAGPAS